MAACLITAVCVSGLGFCSGSDSVYSFMVVKIAKQGGIDKLIPSLCVVCLSLLHPTATGLTGVTEPPFAGISPGSA